MSESRLVLAAPASTALEVRKSRFVANATRVESETTAHEFLQHVSDPTATHNCWAWRIGQQYRFNDDGEPGGSAGKPILQAIDGQHVDQVVVVVTRWFGGIKLGVGGLIRAYGGVAAECLRRAARKPLIDSVDVCFAMGYAELPLFKARTQGWNLVLENEDFGPDNVKLSARVARENLPALQRLVADLSRGSSRVRVLDKGTSG